MSNIDPYIDHMMKNNPSPEARFAFLLQADASFDPREVPGLTVHSKLGNILGCVATRAAIEILRKDRRVWSIESSR